MEEKKAFVDEFSDEFGMPLSQVNQMLDEAAEDFKNGRYMTEEEFIARVKEDYGVILG